MLTNTHCCLDGLAANLARSTRYRCCMNYTVSEEIVFCVRCPPSSVNFKLETKTVHSGMYGNGFPYQSDIVQKANFVSKSCLKRKN